MFLHLIAMNPRANIISFPYYYKGESTKKTDNRMHGKIYKRAFLEKYGITFAPKSSYMDEDIGFNRTCRYCTEAENEPILYIDLPIIEWKYSADSLTQKDNGAALYRDQTRALSLVSIHTIETLRKNNISDKEEINQIALYLYYWFIRTAAERPEFLQEAWSGAKIFYDNYKNEIKPDHLTLGNAALKKSLQYKDKISFPINVLRFADDIWKNEIIPDKYLTLN